MKILIDNGHGDNTPGKRSPYSCTKVEPAIEFYEYKWNREIAERIVNELLSIGYDAELLTPEINDVSITERIIRTNTFCNKLGKENVLLISVHANAAGDGSKWLNGKGWSAYTSVGQTNSDKLAECLYKAANINFEGRKIRTETFDGDSDYESDFSICKKTKCVAVLTENFFFDNVDDVNYILSEKGKDAVVRTHVEGIINFLK